MDESNFSIDSRDNETEKLKDQLITQQNLVKNQEKIISSLRLQNTELNYDNEELEKEQQLSRQKVDRLERTVVEKTQELEAVSHALHELETSTESMRKRLDLKNEQIQKIVRDLADSKSDSEKLAKINQELSLEIQELKVQLEGSKRSTRSRDREDSEQAMAQELHNTKTQLNLIRQQNNNLNEQHQLECNQLTEELAKLNENHQAEIQRLTLELTKMNQQIAKLSAEKQASNNHPEQTSEEMVQELYDLRAQVKTLSHRLNRRSVDEQIRTLQEELKVTETSWKLERFHKERYAKENCLLEKKVSDLTKELYKHKTSKPAITPPPPLPPKPNQQMASQPAVVRPVVKIENENRSEMTAGIHFSMADEDGEIMHSRNLNPNKRPATAFSENSNSQSSCGEIPTSLHKHLKQQPLDEDPMVEYKMRCARAKELARRNMQTKPLHQTSYPLELDTFDNLSEIDIKRGKLHRPALVDSSNKRKPVKKAEAFIV